MKNSENSPDLVVRAVAFMQVNQGSVLASRLKCGMVKYFDIFLSKIVRCQHTQLNYLRCAAWGVIKFK